MDNFKFKFNKWILICCYVLIAVCLFMAVQSALRLIGSTLAADIFSAAFFLLLNVTVLVSAAVFVLKSGYNLADKEFVVKTAYFNDPVSYDSIKKILYFVTEEELYLQLSGNDEYADYLKINIQNADFPKFVNALKKRIPDAPYEISLSLETDE